MEDKCMICLEKNNKKSYYSDVCGHTFHKKCIRKLRLHDEGKVTRCPVCREYLDSFTNTYDKTINYAYEYINEYEEYEKGLLE